MFDGDKRKFSFMYGFTLKSPKQNVNYSTYFYQKNNFTTTYIRFLYYKTYSSMQKYPINCKKVLLIVLFHIFTQAIISGNIYDTRIE